MTLNHAYISTRLPVSSSAGTKTAQTTAPAVLIIFFATLPLLVSDRFGGLRISPNRLFLMIAFIPSVLALLRGQAGRLMASDVAMSLFVIWNIVTVMVNNGPSELPYASITSIETLGSYFLGRVLIRNAEDFRLMIRVYLWVLVALFPFALIEFLTGQVLLHEFYAHFGQTVFKGANSYPRWGFARVMSGFDHPILYGLFCSILASTIFYVYGSVGRRTVFRLGFVGWMTFMSLSAAPLLSLAIQFGLILWDKITRGRWILLSLLTVGAYVALSLLSHRGPIGIVISYLTFNSGTAWTRILQWQFATPAVLAHSIFGLGLKPEWYRPPWLTASIDSYWLAIALVHGLVGVALVLAAFALVVFDVVRARLPSPMLRDYRTGYLIGIVGLSFVLVTVFVWGTVAVFVFFFLGAGSWLTDRGRTTDLEAPEQSQEGALPTVVPKSKALQRGDGRVMTRFAHNHVRRASMSDPESDTKRPDDTRRTPGLGESRELPGRRPGIRPGGGK